MPSCTIDNENGVSTRHDLRRDFIEMPLHCLGITVRQDKARTDTALWTDGTEDIGGLCALILWGSGAGSAPCPAPREFGLLPDPCFILPPNFYRCAARETGPDFL